MWTAMRVGSLVTLAFFLTACQQTTREPAENNSNNKPLVLAKRYAAPREGVPDESFATHAEGTESAYEFSDLAPAPVTTASGAIDLPGLDPVVETAETAPADALGEVRAYGGLSRESGSALESRSLRGIGLMAKAGGGSTHQNDRVDYLLDRFGADEGGLRAEREAVRREAARLAPAAGPLDGEGVGPESSGDKYNRIYENDFKSVGDNPLSTFSIDVDTASYSKVRQYLMAGRLPPPDAVRIEELVNYFPYDYLAPMGDEKPFTSHMEVCECPWKPEHRLARIAIKGKEIKKDKRPVSNIVFLIDVSGSMNQPNKLPLVIRGMKMLVEELGEHDRVAIAVYASAAGLVLPSTPGNEKQTIIEALDKLSAGGSTAGGKGLQLAYQTAKDNFIEGGVNRVLLCTDGDFNVGVSDAGGIVRLAEEQAKNRIFLSILGFGMGNLNDAMLEQVANKANGMYAFIDTPSEARKVLVEQLSGTLVTIAKDVKIQIEFNPKKVQSYRLIGYENRLLAAEDFNDDTKDAGEIGAGHNVTALYEIVPASAGSELKTPEVNELKYQKDRELTSDADGDELLTLKLRYKTPDGDTSWKQEFPIKDNTQRFSETSDDFQFAAAVASFGMLLRDSAHNGNITLDAVHEIAGAALGKDEAGYRKEFLTLVEKAKAMKKP